MLIRATKMVSLVDMIFLKKLQTSDTKWHVCTHVENHLTRCNRWFLDTCWPQQVLNGHHLDKPLTRKWHEWHAQTLSNIWFFPNPLASPRWKKALWPPVRVPKIWANLDLCGEGPWFLSRKQILFPKSDNSADLYINKFHSWPRNDVR